jgi:hypothetical protein
VSGGPDGWLIGLVVDPRWGIPVLLMLEAALLWVAWNPRPPPALGAQRGSWTRPSGDPVSRIFYALGDGQYSVLLRWTRERIAELYQARNGEPLPASVFGIRAWLRGLPEDSSRVRRLAREIGAQEWEAHERETGGHVRWAFWRTKARDEAIYRDRIEALLLRGHDAILQLEAPA